MDAIKFEEDTCSIALDGLKSSGMHFSTTNLVTDSLSGRL